MLIEGFGFDGFRSYGKDQAKFGPLRKLNFFIGQNNTGKSNILVFVKRFYSKSLTHAQHKQEIQLEKERLDSHNGNEGPLTISFGMEIDGELYKATLERISERVKQDARLLSSVEKIIRSQSLTRGTTVAWFRYRERRKPPMAPDMVDDLMSEKVLGESQWQGLWTRLTGQSGGNAKTVWIPETLHELAPIHLGAPQIAFVPAIRRVGDAGSKPEDFSGIGLIDRLAQLQNPAYDRQDLKTDFDKINSFLRRVTGKKDATIEIPYERDAILVHMDDKILPLSYLGTGVHEVIIIAAAATILREQVICIEEPELHLHPLLQKQLVRYLSQETTNQYFITTHSAHVLDTPNAALFHIRNQGGISGVEGVSTDTGKASICADLGYRAADLLQANCIIWVEGPSDRLYVNHWISTSDPSLLEGVHYSIMFYGGRLLSHLTADDDEVTDFIRLRRLNRHLSILIDSDQNSSEAEINPTKARVKKEFDKGSGFAWITSGREIENYLDPVILEQSVKTIYADAQCLAHKDNIYEHALHYKIQDGSIKVRIDKVKIAHEMCKTPPNLDILDLKARISQLLVFIRSSNDPETA